MIIRTPSIRNSQFLDGEYLYDYYFRVMGTARSQRKLPAVAEAAGMKNILGGGPSIMGCWKAMWRWACDPKNHQKAYEIYNTAMADYGLFYTFEQFRQVLREKAETTTQFKSDRQRKRYWKRHGLE